MVECNDAVNHAFKTGPLEDTAMMRRAFCDRSDQSGLAVKW